MSGARSRRTEVLVFVCVVAAAAVAIVAVSRALQPAPDMPVTAGSGQETTSPASSSVSPQPAAVATGEPQVCASCWGDGGPDPTVAGEAEVVDGVQIVRVGVEDGYYVPNEFTVQAGLPVTVVFSGPAEGCLAEPEFPDLGAKADFSGGSATMELGALAPGSYPFTCSMGVNEGHITVE